MTPAEAGRDRQRWLGGAVLATGVAVFTVALAFRVAEAARTMGALVFDWTFYSAAVQRWLAGEPIYPGGVISTLGTAAGASYAYPPSSVPLMLPFASWPLGAILWEACLLLVFWTGVWTVIDRGWPDRRALALGIALLAAAFFQPVLDGFAFGNVNIATAGALAWVWTSRRAAISSATVLGTLKVFPFALAAPYGFRALAVAGVAVTAIVLVTLPMVGVESWVDYLSGLRQATMVCGDPTFFNPSFACLVAPLVGATVAKWLGLGLAAVLVLLAVRAGPTVTGCTLVAAAIMAPAIELHSHYLAMLYVLVVIALASVSVRARSAAAAPTPEPA